MDPLPLVWFIAIAVLWTGYLLLEGFDLGVGMHLLISARGEKDRRVMLNTIGPVWDGNEVWLITAAAATFAAFPFWYASLLSAFYAPLVIVLLALIFRAVGIEYRGKRAVRRWTRAWDAAIGIGSFFAAFGIGALLGATTTGLPLDANGDRVGGPLAWLTPGAIIGGLAVVGFALAHGATFLGLKSDGPVRIRAGRFAARWAPAALIPLAGWAVLVLWRSGDALSWTLLAAGAAAGLAGWSAALRRREGWAFAGYAALAALGASAIFVAAFPVVLPSTLDSSYDLTVWNAASGSYTLGVMSVVAAFGLPLVIGYQAWSYWVFRRRVGPSHIPVAHEVVSAVRS